eukprot:3201396-Ditylum_brightwellii.AAC.1
MHWFMPRCRGKASVDEARIPCDGRAPCIRVLKSKPIKRGWILWCAVDCPYLHFHWAIDNWFTSKPLYDEMVQLGQYPYGTMEVK